MKISNTQYNVSRWGDEKYKKLREIGFEAIDFSNNITKDHSNCKISNEEFLEAVKREKPLIDDAGLEIHQMHGPWRWPPQDYAPEDRADRMSRMQTSIEACALLGCKNWVVHNIMPFGHEDLKLDKGEETRAMNKEFFKALSDTAHKFGVNICIENMPMPNFSMATPQNVLDFIDELSDDCFRVCLDVGHAAVIPGVDPVESVYRVKDKLAAVHIHDNLGKVDQHFIPYFGIIDWANVGKALRDINFGGVFSLEVEAPKNLPDPLFEEAFRLIFKIAKSIAEE